MWSAVSFLPDLRFRLRDGDWLLSPALLPSMEIATITPTERRAEHRHSVWHHMGDCVRDLVSPDTALFFLDNKGFSMISYLIKVKAFSKEKKHCSMVTLAKAEDLESLANGTGGGRDGDWRLQISSEHRLRSENLAFDIDVWYPMLKQFTFDTVFLPLRRREAIAVIHYYRTRYIQNSASSKPQLTLYDIQILHSLESAISDLLSDSNHEFRVHGAFMRLCGRSPKDAEPLSRDHVRSLYQQNLERLLNGDNDQDTKYPLTGTWYLCSVHCDGVHTHNV